jgi:hypothetical protein
MVFFQEIVLEKLILKNCPFLNYFFGDEKIKFRKRFKPRTFGLSEGDSNHYINFFPLKIM